MSRVIVIKRRYTCGCEWRWDSHGYLDLRRLHNCNLLPDECVGLSNNPSDYKEETRDFTDKDTWEDAPVPFWVFVGALLVLIYLLVSKFIWGQW